MELVRGFEPHTIVCEVSASSFQIHPAQQWLMFDMLKTKICFHRVVGELHYSIMKQNQSKV